MITTLFSCGSNDEEISPTTDLGDFTLTSEAISNGELLDDFKCESKTDGIENSIPLAWSNVPSGTGSLAIVMFHYPNSDDLSDINSYLHLWNIYQNPSNGILVLN